MIINCAYRYELKPNCSQDVLLSKHAGTAPIVYTFGVMWDIVKTDSTDSHVFLTQYKTIKLFFYLLKSLKNNRLSFFLNS